MFLKKSVSAGGMPLSVVRRCLPTDTALLLREAQPRAFF